MIYPDIKLSEVGTRTVVADHADDPDRGAFIEIDKSPDQVRVRIDRFSQVILYYAVHQDRLYGATTFAGLCAELPGDFPRRLHDEAAIQFVRANSMIGDKTLMRGVKRLSPGGVLRFDRRTGRHEVDQWWRLHCWCTGARNGTAADAGPRCPRCPRHEESESLGHIHRAPPPFTKKV